MTDERYSVVIISEKCIEKVYEEKHTGRQINRKIIPTHLIKLKWRPMKF